MTQSYLKCPQCDFKRETPEDGLADEQYRTIRHHLKLKHHTYYGDPELLLETEASAIH